MKQNNLPASVDDGESYNKIQAHKIPFKDKYAHILLPALLVIIDYCAVLASEQLAFMLRNFLIKNHGTLHISPLHFYVVCPAIFLLFLHICQLHTRQMQFWRVVSGIFKACLYGILAEVLFLYVIQIADTTSRLYTVLLWFFMFLTILLFRYIVKVLLDKTGFISELVLLMGAGNNADIILKHLRIDMGIPYRFIGYLEDEQADAEAGLQLQLPKLGTFAEAASVIRETGVQKVLIIASGLRRERIQDIIYELQPLVRSVSVIPDVETLPFLTMDIESLIDGRIVMFRMRNNLQNKWNRAFKFIFDWCAALLGSIIFSPVMFGIALWIRKDSPGPVIFKHRRIGQYGKEFSCYKFRTMCVDAKEKLEELLEADPEAKKEWEENYKLKNDPRITRSGKFLRRTSLDELPQIFNVLKGEMSLVGPRPIVAKEIRYYGKFIEDYYMVRPGITGMWQTGGRNDTGYEQRVRMDSWYVRNWDFWFDIVLLWRTLKVVIKGDGAY